MTRKLLTTAALTVLISACLPLNARADITTGLVGYWNFNDGPGSLTAADASSSANNGTLTGFSDGTYNNMWTTALDPVNGWPYALLFNQGAETTDYVSIPDIAALDIGANTRAITVSAWVNPSVAASSENAILCKGNGSGPENYCLDVYSSKFRFFTHNSAASATITATASVGPTTLGTWYHVVGTFTEPSGSSTITIYVNGVSSGSSTATYTTMENTSHVVSIGNRQSSNAGGAYNLPWHGTIDDVRIYNRALSASDVAQLYANEAHRVINNGIGSWNGLAGSGGNATLDTTSLNFGTNLYTAPLATTNSLADLLAVEQALALPPSCAFADFYYSNKTAVAVSSTNLTIATGGVALGTASAAGTMTFLNVATTYILNSSDAIGIKDGTLATSLVQSGNGKVILTGTNTFTGGLTINSGTVQLGNGGAVSGQELGTAATVTDNGALVFNGNNSLSFSKTISGSGSVTQKGVRHADIERGQHLFRRHDHHDQHGPGGGHRRHRERHAGDRPGYPERRHAALYRHGRDYGAPLSRDEWHDQHR